MKGRIKQKLYSLASGELVALAVFWFNFLLFKKYLVRPQALIAIAYPLLLVSLILLQGSLGMPIILIEFSSWPVSLIAVAIWLFALIEWINYFHWQLSYSLNPLVLLNKVAKRKLRKSKIAKEIEKSN